MLPTHSQSKQGKMGACVAGTGFLGKREKFRGCAHMRGEKGEEAYSIL